MHVGAKMATFNSKLAPSSGCLKVSPNLADGWPWLGKARGAIDEIIGILLENFTFSHWLKADWCTFFLEIRQLLHTLEAHVHGSFAKKALLQAFFTDFVEIKSARKHRHTEFLQKKTEFFKGKSEFSQENLSFRGKLHTFCWKQ